MTESHRRAPLRPPGKPRGPVAVAEHYRSVDSAPAHYARVEPPSRTNGFLLAFAAVSLLLQLGFTAYAQTGSAPSGRDLVFFTNGGQHSIIPARLFLLAFFGVFAFWIDTNLWRRTVVAAELLGGLLAASFVIDLLAVLMDDYGPVQVQVFTQQVLSALVALVLFPVVITRNSVLPPAGPSPPAPAHGIPWYAWARVVVPAVVSVALAATVEIKFADEIAWMRSWALLGGVGPGIFLVQQAFVIQTAIIGLWMIRRSQRRHRVFHPPVAVLVPAHNEAHGIAATIAAVAAAARSYRGGVHLYVVDNSSTDNTVAVAQAAIGAAEGLAGEVLECDQPGKAIALNYGLSRIEEEFVVRIDADTVIGEGCLDIAMRHLAHPEIAAVGGVPLPSGNRGFFDRVRLVEVLLRHGFYQVGLVGIGGVLGIPGMFAVYRKEALDRAGELVQGMNGEDTDICLRMSAAGYRVVVDPAATYYSETPDSWAHLREQRTRWFRSIYHVAGHNRRLVFQTRSMASAVTLPFQLASAARRAMFAPILVAALIALVVFPNTFPGVDWAPIIATIVGLPFLVAVLVCVVWRRWCALLYIPEYLVFRVIRSWFTLGAVLSLVYPPLHLGGARRTRAGAASE